MIKELYLKERIKKNWVCIIIFFSFIITLLNYFELKTENSRLRNKSNNLKNKYDYIESENSDLEDEKVYLEEENEELKSEKKDY